MSHTSLDDVIEAQSGGRSRRDARRDSRRQKDRRRKRRRGWVTVLVTLSLIVGAGIGAWAGLKPLYDDFTAPKDYEGSGAGKVTIVIPKGASGVQIGRILESAGVVKNASAFVDAAGQDQRSVAIQPGTYALHKQMSSASALEVLVEPQNRIVRRVTVPEGRRAEQVADLLVKKGGFSKAEVQAALKNPKALGLPPAAKGKVEGFLFPSTYEIEPETTAAQALRAMVTKTKSVLSDLGVPAAEQREVITKASIVQAEAGSPDHYGKIARVIENRLAHVQGIRKLEMDSTVAYGVGKYKVLTSSAERDDDNPYNTYAHEGLPAGPIGNPGEGAMAAVVHPPAGSWVYFVTVNFDTGETKFASSSAEHLANKAQMQEWLRENR
jgi:UPF0755 protein